MSKKPSPSTIAVNKKARHLYELSDFVEAGISLTGPEVKSIRAGKINAYTYGELVYFFEYACGLSGYLLGVNPFDQPVVEAHKKNMFALLNKPGYEEMGAALRAKLGR